MTFFLDNFNYRINILFTFFLCFRFYHNTYHWLCTTFTNKDSSCCSECFCNLLYCCLYVSIILCFRFTLYTYILKYLRINTNR